MTMPIIRNNFSIMVLFPVPHKCVSLSSVATDVDWIGQHP